MIFHFFDESVFFFVLGWLWGLILGGFGDLWGQFCDLLEVQKSSEILRCILEAKVTKKESAAGPGRGVGGPKRRLEIPQTAASRPTVSRPADQRTRGPENDSSQQTHSEHTTTQRTRK